MCDETERTQTTIQSLSKDELVHEILKQNEFIRSKFENTAEGSPELEKQTRDLKNFTNSNMQDIKYLYDQQDRMMILLEKVINRLDSIENINSHPPNNGSFNAEKKNDSNISDPSECFEFALPMHPRLFQKPMFPIDLFLHKMRSESIPRPKSPSNIEEIHDL